MTKKEDTNKQKKTDKSKKVKNKKDLNFNEVIDKLQQKLKQAEEREKRAFADYKNLQRRNREERIMLIKMANRELIETLLEPYGNLIRAAEQLDDEGLNMVIRQFKQMLEELGIREIKCMGKPFNVDEMDVVDRIGKGKKVVEVVELGYKMNDEVIRHAKVIMG